METQRRKVENVKAMIMIRADKSDPLNQMVVVAFRARVDGEEVGGRCAVSDEGGTYKKQIECIQDALAGLIAKLLSGQEPFLLGSGSTLGDRYPSEMVHEQHWKRRCDNVPG